MPASPDLRWRLRDATLAAHARLDAHAAFDDAPGYAAFLAGMHGFMQAARDATGDAGLEAANAALTADLHAVGAVPTEAIRTDGVPVAEAMGWRYVLAGASLGARVLAPRALALGFDAAHGARFLAAQCTGDAWPQWLHEAAALPADEHEAAVAGACHAFATAEAAMSRARATA